MRKRSRIGSGEKRKPEGSIEKKSGEKRRNVRKRDCVLNKSGVSNDAARKRSRSENGAKKNGENESAARRRHAAKNSGASESAEDDEKRRRAERKSDANGND